MDGYGGFERFILLGLLMTFIFKIIHHSTKGVVLDMLLMIIVALVVLTTTIVYALKDIYINKFSLEGSLKGFKLSFETKIKKDPPSDKK